MDFQKIKIKNTNIIFLTCIVFFFSKKRILENIKKNIKHSCIAFFFLKDDFWEIKNERN